MFSLTVNGKRYRVKVDGDTPLLWVIRERIGLTGTKYGCGMALCGACTVLVNGKPERSCQVPVKDAQGKKITTIEGIPSTHPVKRAWIEEDVPQCGYCQSGQIIEAVALLQKKPKPSESDIDEHLSGCLCRCGTYQRIRKAIHTAAVIGRKGGRK